MRLLLIEAMTLRITYLTIVAITSAYSMYVLPNRRCIVLKLGRICRLGHVREKVFRMILEMIY